MKFIYLLGMLLLLFTCNPAGELIEEDTVIVSFDFGENLEYWRIFYFITDSTNQVIASEQVLTNGRLKLISDQLRGLEKFNLHLVKISTDNEIRWLDSYFQISDRNLDFSYSCPSVNLNKLGNANFKIAIDQKYDLYDFLISYPGGGYSGNVIPGFLESGVWLQSDLYEGHEFIYYFVKLEDLYYYDYIHFQPNQSKSFLFDPTIDLKTDVDIASLPLPEGWKYNRSSVYANMLGNSCFYSAYEIYSEPNKDSTHLKIIIPHNAYHDYYKSLITLKKGENSYLRYYIEGAIPVSIPATTFELKVKSFDIANIELETIGSYDFVEGRIQGEFSNLTQWIFYSPSGKKIEFPEFPNQVLALYPDLSSQSFFDTNAIRSSISLNDAMEVKNYDHFIENIRFYPPHRYLNGVVYKVINR